MIDKEVEVRKSVQSVYLQKYLVLQVKRDCNSARMWLALGEGNSFGSLHSPGNRTQETGQSSSNLGISRDSVTLMDGIFVVRVPA